MADNKMLLFTSTGRERICSMLPDSKIKPHNEGFLYQGNPPDILSDEDVTKILSDRLLQTQTVDANSDILDLLARTISILVRKYKFRMYVPTGIIEGCIREAESILLRHRNKTDPDMPDEDTNQATDEVAGTGGDE